MPNGIPPFIDRVIFQAASGGTGDFVEVTFVTGYQTMEAGVAVSGAEYHYAAQTTDLSQWEVGKGLWDAATQTLSRVTVLFNNLGTTAKINFASAPQVMVTVFAEDLMRLSTEDRTFYVRTDGSDSNSGLTNTPTGAFRTIRYACRVAALAALGTYHYDVLPPFLPLVIINVADGTYVEHVNLPQIVGGILTPDVGVGLIHIVGNTTTPSNVVVGDTTGEETFSADGCNGWYITGIKTVGSAIHFNAVCGGILRLGKVEVGLADDNNYQIDAHNNSQIIVTGPVVVSGNAYCFAAASQHSIIEFFDTVTFTGTPAFSHSTIQCRLHSYMGFFGAISGAATGKRFDIAGKSFVYTGLNSLTVFPGDAIGTFETGGELDAFNYREVITADRIYYVRTDGSDSNDGFANTVGGAFLTIQHAIDVVAGLDLDGVFRVKVFVADGTYAEHVSFSDPVGSPGDKVNNALDDSAACNLIGNATTPTNVDVAPASGEVVTVRGSKAWQLRGFSLHQVSNSVIAIINAGRILLNSVDYQIDNTSNYTNLIVGNGSILAIAGPLTIGGAGADSFIACLNNGEWINSGGSITISGTPNFDTAFALANVVGFISNFSTITGSATGKRYSVTLNGVINTFGGGANYFPGDVAGTTATGGQYA